MLQRLGIFRLSIHRQFILNMKIVVLFINIVFLIGWGTISAQAATPSSGELEQLRLTLTVGLDTFWVVFTSCLVFFMNAGFALLVAGFCRQSSVVGLLAQNFLVFALSSLIFWAFGFGLMFGDGTPLLGLQGFFLQGADNSLQSGLPYVGIYSSLNWARIPLLTKFFFQLALSAIAATLVLGAVAERIKFLAFLLFSLWLVGLVYPLTGHWIWGGGWLAQLGFEDFAGATVIHSVGGWAALVGTCLIGPRLGKYRGGRSLALPGHSLPLASLGGWILWLGGLGLNAGSTMNLNPLIVSHILSATNLAAAAGALSATFVCWLYWNKPDLTLTLNGFLGGIVAISGVSRFVTLEWAVVVGLIAGAIVIYFIELLDRLGIDDPAGAIPVHLVCGLWGTLAVALCALGANEPLNAQYILYEVGPPRGLLLGGGGAALQQTIVQLLGIMAVSWIVVSLSWLGWILIRGLVGLRVSIETELTGLDINEQGMHAYSGFQQQRSNSSQKTESRELRKETLSKNGSFIE
jgi:Amt family ammonium transporter